MSFSRCFAALFVFGCAGAFGCSGENEPNAEDGDETGGSSGGSGTGGSSGGSGTATCLNVCERTRECPDAAPLDCAGRCNTFATGPCAPLADLAFACISQGDVCDPLPPACVDEIDAHNICIEDEGTGGGCSPENAPSNASCETICAGSPISCFDTEADCVESCSNGLARSELVTCSGEYQAMLGCISTCADICALSVYDCPDARSAFLDCDARYCEANPDSEPCRPETI
jgi:hypothetical protein